MSNSSKEIYEFATFRLEVSERKLLRAGKSVGLPDKAFDTLSALVRRPGELVTKDELMSAVWPETVVEENNLDQKISVLRKVLGEKGRGKEKFIETVRGHGYRFVQEVRRVHETSVAEAAAAGPKNAAGERPVTAHPTYPVRTHSSGNVVAVAAWQHPVESSEPRASEASAEGSLYPDHGAPGSTAVPGEAASGVRRLGLQSALAASILIGLIAVAWAILSPAGASPAGPQIASIAILPFANETGDPATDYLSDGLTDSLIVSISQIPNLSVKARSSVFLYRDKQIDPTAAGKQLSTQAVLTGRLTRMGDDLSIGLELVDVASGDVIWADRFHRRASELPQLQSEIARDVAARLRSRLSRADEQRVARVHTSDPEANHYYLQGLFHLNKRSAEDIRISITHFQRATLEDPGYAQAYAATALAHIILPDYSGGMSRDDIKRAEQDFREAFLRARDLDDTLPEVHVLAAINCELEWNIPCAVESYRRAIELDPNFALARHVSSRLYGSIGRTDEALDQIYKARELDPLSPSIAFNVGGRLADARRYDEAIQQFKSVLKMQPDHPLSHYGLAVAYEATGLYRDAISEYRAAWVLLEKFGAREADAKAAELAKGLEKSGPRGYWETRLQHQRAEYEKGTGQRVRIAACLARLGRVDEAIQELERAWADREPDMLWIRSEQAFDVLHDNPRFDDLTRRIGVKF